MRIGIAGAGPAGLLFALLAKRRRADADIRIVEQNPRMILPITQRAVVLDRGMVVHEGASAALLADRAQLDRWLAVAKT